MVSVDKMFMASLDHQVIVITVCTHHAHVQCMCILFVGMYRQIGHVYIICASE